MNTQDWEPGVKMRPIEIDYTVKSIEQLYAHFCKQYQCTAFFDTLRKYANKPEVKYVAEFGVFQGGSTSAFLTCDIKALWSYDIDISIIDESLFRALNPKPAWKLTELDSTSHSLIVSNLTLLDTRHTYEHVMRELQVHGDNTSHYIAVHDTNYPPANRNPKKLVGDAVLEWAKANDWQLLEHSKRSSGFMVIGRK